MSLAVLAQEKAKNAVELPPLVRSDREAALEAALLDLGFENAWEIAPTLVSLGFDRSELTTLIGDFNPS